MLVLPHSAALFALNPDRESRFYIVMSEYFYIQNILCKHPRTKQKLNSRTTKVTLAECLYKTIPIPPVIASRDLIFKAKIIATCDAPMASAQAAPASPR
jgi:hypothetical protein